jgi:hypothetical protein
MHGKLYRKNISFYLSKATTGLRVGLLFSKLIQLAGFVSECIVQYSFDSDSYAKCRVFNEKVQKPTILCSKLIPVASFSGADEVILPVYLP